jgi:tetratricopeptide (TPR) repeat protein
LTLTIVVLSFILQAPTPGCQDLVARGRDAYDARRFPDAAVSFDAAIGRCGATEPLLLALGQAQLLARQVASSIATLERLLALNPSSVDALKVYARALYLAARDDDAIRALTTAAALAPQDDEVCYDRGRIYYQMRRYADAAAQFTRAIALNPRSHKAYDNLGLATEALGNPDQAIRYYLKAIDLVHSGHPKYDVVYANLADLMLKVGEDRKAFDLAAEAAQRNPDDARNLFLAGKALVKLEQLDVSLKWLERAIALDPSYPEPHYLLAQALRRLGRSEEADRALKGFQQARARAPAVRR